MKKCLLLFYALSIAFLSTAQTTDPSIVDTVIIPVNKHEMLHDVVVIDDWEANHQTAESATDHQLEMQLKQLKGVNLISRGTFAQEAIYRGQQDTRFQVRLNGMRIYSACTDRMDPATSYVVANNLKTAEVSSACEAHCSNSGLAGNLNLQLKQATFNKDKNWRWGLSQQYHTNTNGLVSGLNLENQSGNLAWRLNGSWQRHNNYSAGGNEEVRYSQNQKQNWALNTTYRLSSKELLKLDLIYDLATDVGYPALPMDVSQARAVIAGLTYSNHKGLWKFGRYDLKIYHNDIYHEMDDTQRENVFMHMDMPGWSQTTGLNLNAYDWQTGKHELSTSFEYYTNFRRAEMTMYPPNAEEPAMFMLTWPDARIHGLGTGITDHWHFGKFHLNTSLRLDYETSGILDEFGTKQWEGMGYDLTRNRSFVLPQIKTALAYQLSKKHKVNSALSYGQRGPSTSELYGFYLFNAHDGFDYLGNPDLKPEELYTAEVGHEFTGDKISTSVTTYVQRYSNYIFGLTSDYDAMTWGANGVRIYENVKKATFYGIEASGRYKASSKLEAFAKGEYLRGMLHSDFNLPLIPPLQGTIGAAYKLNQWNFLAQSRLANEQKLYNTEYGDRYTPGYALLDLKVAYSLPLKNTQLELELAANNLLDSYYRDHLNWGGIPSMGRNIILKMTFTH